MTSLLMSMVVSFLVSMGARDQMLVSQLRGMLGNSAGLLVVALATSTATAFIAAWFGGLLGQGMSQDASTMFVAIAMLLAAVECVWPNRAGRPVEPTRSLGAVAIVLFSRQLTDASRFLIAAFALVFASPPLAGLGGAIGGGTTVALGWALGDRLEALPLRGLRRVLGVALFFLAIAIGLTARGLI
jgi:hypothetical protein